MLSYEVFANTFKVKYKKFKNNLSFLFNNIAKLFLYSKIKYIYK